MAAENQFTCDEKLVSGEVVNGVGQLPDLGTGLRIKVLLYDEGMHILQSNEVVETFG